MKRALNLFNYSVLLLIIFLILIFEKSSIAKSNVTKKEAVNAIFKSSLDLEKPDIIYINSQLILQNYTIVENIFEELLEQYKQDVIYESPLQRGFNLFCSKNGVSLAILDSWVNKKGSAIAYAARGIYKAQEGFAVRGNKFINETSNKSLNEMRSYHLEAVTDLQTAINKNPQILPTYGWLIQIAKASPMSFTEKEILDKALANDNRTYYVRFQYMMSLTPKWGGSHLDMERFAKKAASHSNLNPQLWSLLGEVDADKGNYYWFNKDYSMAAKMYSSALEYGDCISWLQYRAGCYYYLGLFEKAIDDLDLILYYKPYYELATKWKLYSQIELAKNN